MLMLPTLPSIYRYIALDPGTDTLGVAVFDLDLATGIARIPWVSTLRASRSNHFNDYAATLHGDRYARLNAHHARLVELFQQFQPQLIASESPYMGRFPQAYAALVECMQIIQSAVTQYDYGLSVLTVEPTAAKKAVGVLKRGSNKDLVRDLVLAKPELQFIGGVNPYTLDEHSTDALAVGYFVLQQIMQYARA